MDEKQCGCHTIELKEELAKRSSDMIAYLIKLYENQEGIKVNCKIKRLE